MILFYDTETTGFPLGEPSDDPRQPHIVQVCAWLVDPETRKPVASIDLIVKPDGWEIPQKVIDIHGITNEHAARAGVRESLAVDALLALWVQATVRVAHNETFDARIVEIAIGRIFHDDYPPEIVSHLLEKWREGEAQCTMKLAQPICALPNDKPPKLIEAYRHFFGSDFDGAHTAAADVAACAAVYWAIKDRQS